MRTLGGVAAACVGTLALGGGTASARVVGDGTARSCTSAAVVAAVRAGGHPPQVTLSGGGKRRILYMNTCDPAQKFTTSHCQDQATPRLTVKDIAFERGNATGERLTAVAAARSSRAAAGCASSAPPSPATAATARDPTSEAEPSACSRNTTGGRST